MIGWLQRLSPTTCLILARSDFKSKGLQRSWDSSLSSDEQARNVSDLSTIAFNIDFMIVGVSTYPLDGMSGCPPRIKRALINVRSSFSVFG
jgi:hypothetical protein